MRDHFKKWGLRAFGLCCAGVAMLIGYLAVLHYNGNFHAVVAGELYRSAQMVDGQLGDYTSAVGLKSVLNLRGPAPGAEWYEAELADSARLGLEHADYGLSASRQVTIEQAAELIALMRRLPKPLLIHCKHGSDRSGLIAALYMAAIAGEDAETAARQLSIYYGHFAVPYLSDAYPMDESWERLEDVMQFAEN